MIRELEKKREENLARAFIDIPASSLGYRVIPAPGPLSYEIAHQFKDNVRAFSSAANRLEKALNGPPVPMKPL
ncbi:hypothetical protein EPICR_140023 [Candidatus Desulfarcum epimagneticum]|uniref:Uncharacterized protein n=1 Tax=uncultured Desulfobacteraceae bacterium TaxID=218296 RepID=A0A484HHX8_9BACT|nr:hypothetical protein EPICR_140023 [uncultured Desulfobacteraceae bacterium]